MKSAEKNKMLLILKNKTGCRWVPEFKFHNTRKWRFDFACPGKKVAIEIDGGVWAYGRHNRASGYVKDLEKFNQAAVYGWRVLKYTSVKKFEKNLKEVQECINDN